MQEWWFAARRKRQGPWAEPLSSPSFQAAAYRIFAKLGFDEGVAGHITVSLWRRMLSYVTLFADPFAPSAGPRSRRPSLLLAQPLRSLCVPQSLSPFQTRQTQLTSCILQPSMCSASLTSFG